MLLDLKSILEKGVQKKQVRVVVCEGWDERCLQATASVQHLVKIVLLGNPEEIKKKVKELKLNINKAEIIDYKNSPLKDELAKKLTELRKSKGLTLEEAKKLIEDENYFACVYCHAGYANAVAGSAICPTATLMRPALQILREKGKIVSEVSIAEDIKNDRTLFFTDASLNISPSPEELAQMALNAAECARDFKVIPKVALISFSTKGSGGDGPEIKPVLDALRIAKEKEPKLIIDGEMQVDAAVSPNSAKKKCPNSPLKGEANVLVFPNLNTANVFAHSMLQFSEMKYAFTVLKGMQHPVAILGRSTPLETIKLMLLSCAMQVNAK